MPHLYAICMINIFIFYIYFLKLFFKILCNCQDYLLIYIYNFKNHNVHLQHLAEKSNRITYGISNFNHQLMKYYNVQTIYSSYYISYVI